MHESAAATPLPVTGHTVGSFLFDYLHQQGINDAFGIPGDFVLPTCRWLEQSKINFVTMTHEPSVGFAADCYARVNGMGLAVVTYCVGGLNMLNSIACAYAEKSRVIVVSGGPSPQERFKDPLVHHKVRTFDSQRRIFEEVTCANTVLLDPKNAAAEIVRVVEEVKRQCRPGYIEVPFDIVDMPIEVPPSLLAPKEQDPNVKVSDVELLEEAVREAAAKINAAKQPVILACVELHRFGLTDMAVQFAQKFNIPIAATLLGKSVIRETNPLYIGVYSGALSEPVCQEYINSSDCVVMLGTFVSDVLLGFYSDKLNRKNAIIATSEQASVGLHGYPDVLLKDFLEALLKSDINKRGEFKNPNPAQLPKPLEKSERDDKLKVEDVFRILGTKLDDGSTVVCDTGDALVGAIGLRTSTRKNFLADAYYLSMGFAVPGAIGAQFANPDNRVFVLVGDGAFQMTGMELSTAAKYGLDPIVIVLNNDGYGTQRHILDGPFNNIHMWKYSKISEFLNYGTSVLVETKGALDDALAAAVKSDTMTVIEVRVPKDDCSGSLKRLGEQLGKLRDKEKRK